jgi:TPR repeat protein
MPASAFRRAAPLLALLAALAILAPSPAAAQFTEIDKLNAARDAYNAKNYDKAFYDWLGLCQAGNRGACFNLGRMYANGVGAPQDYIESYKWMHLAAEAGLPEAIAARARLASEMSASEIKLSMDRAEQWKIDVGRR